MSLALPKIEARRGSTTFVGATEEPFRPPTSEVRLKTRKAAVAAVSRRLVEEARQTAPAYKEQLSAVSEILATHPRLVAEAREDRQTRARMRRVGKKKGMRPDNPLLMYPQPDWNPSGAGAAANCFYGMPAIAEK